MEEDKEYSAVERELTRALLVDLLAYQLCSPVQWIKAQETILHDFATEKLIEIGPASTLINMAKKTIKADGYEFSDVARGLERQLLSYKTDADAIYYRYPEDGEHFESEAPAKPDSSSVQLKVTPVPTEAVTKSAVVVSQEISIPDKALCAADLVRAIVAVALKKSPDGISQDQTIKALCGGRSTVQNEIIGDLIKEFKSLPDQPEDLPLSDLGNTLSESGIGRKLGPCTSSLVGRMVTTKMPAGFGAGVMRQYLSSRWSFKDGLQDQALLFALFRQPESRLPGEKDAHSYLDGIAHEVLKNIGVDPLSLLSKEKQPSTGPVLVSSEAMTTLKKEQRERDMKLFQLHAKRVGHTNQVATAEAAARERALEDLQKRVDSWSVELGEEYERGISPMFDARKVRKFDSYWNWVIQDLYTAYSSASSGELEVLEAAAKEDYGCFARRVTHQLLDVIPRLQEGVRDIAHAPVREAVEIWLVGLQKACTDLIHQPDPRLKCSVASEVPVLEISKEGKAVVRTTPRLSRPPLVTKQTSHSDTISEEYSFGQSTPSDTSGCDAVFSQQPTAGDSFDESVARGPLSGMPSIRRATTISTWSPEIRTKSQDGWCRNDEITSVYSHWLQQASWEGISFRDKSIVITGAGKNSIGSEIVRFCLSAGARVLVTTSSYSKQTVDYYQKIYRTHGARGSQLVVVPWNGGSQRDVRNLVRYVYDDLNWVPDHIIPFAAVGEAGRAIDGLDERSELAHRVMLTNLLRLLGSIKAENVRRRINTHPTHVILPLSPNHGIFGQDGLYAESKIGLEALMNKWWSEDWQDYLTLCGAVIGWTRGTGLMSNNDTFAAGLERNVGIRTFSTVEMAWQLVGLMDAAIATLCDTEPTKADLSGGLSSTMNVRTALNEIQREISTGVDIQRALLKEQQEMQGGQAAPERARTKISKKARIRIDGIDLPEWGDIAKLTENAEPIVDLDRVVVVVGFGEAGPCGSTRTRWEAECTGTFSIEGCLELAWMMGLITYHNGSIQGKPYCGWIETASKQPIADADVRAKYEDHILQHTGIRLIEKQQHELTTPDKQQMLHEVVVTEDLDPVEVSLETAQDLVRQHGSDKISFGAETTDGQVWVTLRAGVTLFIPRATEFRGAVGAQMPTGWDARTYGIPEDIIAQVDPMTLYALVATVEAFLSAGITDSFELFDHMHVGDLGNAIGSALGGQRAYYAMFKERFLSRQVQNDVLAETFPNTTAAWVNMLLCGASGPIRTPVGACATGLESVDTGFDLVSSGRAKAVLVGGADSLGRDSAHEFANMHATVDAAAELEAGRTPKEASRPTTTTRAGFVQGEGCGVQLLTTARLALDMGLPIRGVVALTHTASDRVGRSVPAPGKGILTIATEQRTDERGGASPVVDLAYRRPLLDQCLQQVEETRLARLRRLDPQTNVGDDALRRVQQQQIEADAARSVRDAYFRYGNDFWKSEPAISPLRGALAVWGLCVDDLDVASLHGTSTQKNDINETGVLQTQLEWLGRKKGNVLPCVLQKSLLGHGLGAAGAFALNGCLQMLSTGLIPGNANADNIDAQLRDRDLLFFPSETYKSTSPIIKAFTVTSFGFGQKGAQVIGVNARYLFATLGKTRYESYRARVKDRERLANRALQQGILGGKLVRVKDSNVYGDDQVETSLLNR
ncbi:hypothetical protein F4778DRAFT_780102 [Xylariomycetidae sp. FL2044]|nr:hypothetical protein F4778DRAFT_780102 [Xylariomycetidae sp. FL2044]